jgi:hypothetical protein
LAKLFRIELHRGIYAAANAMASDTAALQQ